MIQQPPLTPTVHQRHPNSQTIRSPKITTHSQGSRASWFKYYAGFSPEFVQDILLSLDIPSGGIVMDPWLGAGTSLEISVSQEYGFKGVDLNPAMLVVAKARMIPIERIALAVSLSEKAVVRFQGRSDQSALKGTDPLLQWFDGRSAAIIRSLEQAISNSAVGITAQATWQRVDVMTCEEAFVHLALFRVVRGLIQKFRGSNPTWIKLPSGRAKRSVASAKLLKLFEAEINELNGMGRQSAHPILARHQSGVEIKKASSSLLPFESGSVNAVIASPPYCTRIDYVKATLPELAIINFPTSQIKELREKMVGTPTISSNRETEIVEWGESCNAFLRKVKNHPSKASSTYYSKYFNQYFESMYSSLKEITRVTATAAQCVLVVQDSYYKEIHNDLPRIIEEMAVSLGWRMIRKYDFEIKRTLAGINPDVRAYRSSFNANEAVLVLGK